jgi:hypothetical protein
MVSSEQRLEFRRKFGDDVRGRIALSPIQYTSEELKAPLLFFDRASQVQIDAKTGELRGCGGYKQVLPQGLLVSSRRKLVWLDLPFITRYGR